MAKGLIAICEWHECESCINRTETGKCAFIDSVPLNLRMKGLYIHCGLFKEVEKQD